MQGSSGLVHETGKNRVVVGADRVEKTFGRAHGARRRARCERKSLERLRGLDGIPDLLETSPDGRLIATSVIAGTPLPDVSQPPDLVFQSLRELVEEMLARGVARHSLPPRDVLVRPDGRAGLVDFERTTLRWIGGPVWIIAEAIFRFHLARLVERHAPHLLTPRERAMLPWQHGVQRTFRRIIDLRHRWILGVRPPT